MSTDTMIRGLFRALEASIHERLNMIEDVIRLTGSAGAETPVAEAHQETYSAPQDVERIRNLEDQIQTLSARLAALEQSGPAAASGPEVHVHQEGKGESLWIEPMRDLAIELPAVPKPTPEVKPVPVPANSLVSVEEDVVNEVEVSDEEDLPADNDEESVGVEEADEEAAEEEAEEEAAEEAAEEEEGVEIEEFEYKGKTYYRDGDNQVYRMVGEELDETPIGTWDPERQRVLFRRPTSA